MAFPTAGILDAFSGANATLNGTGIWSAGTIWSGDTTLNVISNTVSVAGGSSGSYGDAYTTASYTDSEAYYDIVSVGTNYYFEIMARGQSGTFGGGNPSFYSISVDGGVSNTWTLNRSSGGVYTQLGSSYAHTPVAGEKVGISCIGSLISFYYFTASAWTLKTSSTDATWATGRLGMEMNGTSFIDNYGGGTIVAAGSDIPVPLHGSFQSPLYRM